MADCQCDAYGDLIGPGMMCAGLEQGGVGICNSPMGTPLYCQGKVFSKQASAKDDVSFMFKLAGLSSWGIGCALPHTPDVFTNAAHYRDWIISHIDS